MHNFLPEHLATHRYTKYVTEEKGEETRTVLYYLHLATTTSRDPLLGDLWVEKLCPFQEEEDKKLIMRPRFLPFPDLLQAQKKREEREREKDQQRSQTLLLLLSFVFEMGCGKFPSSLLFLPFRFPLLLLLFLPPPQPPQLTIPKIGF